MSYAYCNVFIGSDTTFRFFNTIRTQGEVSTLLFELVCLANGLQHSEVESFDVLNGDIGYLDENERNIYVNNNVANKMNVKGNLPDSAN